MSITFRSRLPVALATALLWLSCGDTSTPTTVVLIPTFAETVQLSQLELLSGPHRSLYPSESGQVTSGERIKITLSNDEEAGRSLPIEVWGLRSGERAAYGKGETVPILHQAVEVTVALSAIPCGDWCQAGSVDCESDGVRTCMKLANGCTQWSEPVACPAATPSCSFGRCGKSCVNECAEGTVRCAGPQGAQVCGNNDHDTCTEWLETKPCPEGQRCEQGVCATVKDCVDECSIGETQCMGNGVTTCGQFDADGCLDWSPPTSCESGSSCNQGACTPATACTDECVADTCEELNLRRCGQFDLDECHDLAEAVSCASQDPCLVGVCDQVSGCVTTPKTCNTPPEPTCKNTNTQTVYEEQGTCSNGACVYPSKDIQCPNCPACDPCAGVTCNSPSAPVCAPDGITLRTYVGPGSCDTSVCTYPFTDSICDYGCASGACNRSPTKVLLFGGGNGSSLLHDTWIWNGSTWAGASTAGPSGRDVCAMATARGKVILFGGRAGSATLGDTWAWKSNAWTRVATTGPAARYGHAMATALGKILLFGGFTGEYQKDTWLWDGTVWTQVATTGPAARSGHAMATLGNQVVLFGGVSETGVVYNDTWTWNGTSWSRANVLGPSARIAHAMSSLDGRVVVAGGYSDRFLSDTWIWNGTAWSIGGGWSHGGRANMAAGSLNNTIVMFGGNDANYTYDDTWIWNDGGWTGWTLSGPSARSGHAMAGY